MMARIFYFIAALAVLCVVVAASGDDPEGLDVGQQQLEEALRLQAIDADERRFEQALRELKAGR